MSDNFELCFICEKQNAMICNIKNKTKGYCPSCFHRESGYDSDYELFFCHVCGFRYYDLYQQEHEWKCEKCKKLVCSERCFSVTACQTIYCICKNCFDYKCEECGGNLSKDDSITYLWDCDIDLLPICDSCKSLRSKSE